MVKVIVLYGQPTDTAAFEDHYANTHLPLAGKMPNVSRFEASRIVATPDGSAPPYYRIAELWFEDQGTMESTCPRPRARRPWPTFRSSRPAERQC